MKGNFKTIKSVSEGLYKEKGSKFFAFAYPVCEENEIKNIYESLKKEHHNARHHCFAYRLGVNGELFRANDDGEPPHSAGKPILAQIDARSITNTLVIVVRYFGGTLLGIGGLINAYRNATADALNKADIITKMIGHMYTVQFDYSKIKDINRIIQEEALKQIDQDFKEKCTFTLNIPVKEEKRIIERIKKINSVNIINS